MSPTPGPWTLTFHEDARFPDGEMWRADIRAGDVLLVGNHEDFWYPNVPETRADWRVIAAAPDLLSALKLMYALHTGQHPIDRYAETYFDAEKSARAAIAKAEGK